MKDNSFFTEMIDGMASEYGISKKAVARILVYGSKISKEDYDKHGNILGKYTDED